LVAGGAFARSRRWNPGIDKERQVLGDSPDTARTPARWPQTLWIVRHGESAGNVARALAYQKDLDRIDIGARDVDIPLSGRGRQQAAALGRWFSQLPDGERPDVVMTSPYVRAQDTEKRIRQAGGLANREIVCCIDERLREREFGVLDRLTSRGIRELHPEQAELRAAIGKFYHRPPGGESWCDVILRLRSALDTLSLHHAGRRVLIVGHQAVVLCLRYLLEGLDEQEVLAIDKAGEVANCSITEYRLDEAEGAAGGLKLVRYNFTAPLERSGAPVTAEPDESAAAR
jgi:broad specificity phosphatase PhoE